MLYVVERLPMGIEECRFVQLVAREGFAEAGHEVIIPYKRRRNCYRIDEKRMFVEMSRGRSDINDILTHLTFFYIEAEKVMRKSLDRKGQISDNWLQLEEVVMNGREEVDEKKALVYLSNVLGRTVLETQAAVKRFKQSPGSNSLYHLVYWMGRLAIEEEKDHSRREVIFSAKLRDVIGHHVYGDEWAEHIKKFLAQKAWLQREVHIISANLHSVVNCLYGPAALAGNGHSSLEDLAMHTSKHPAEFEKVRQYATAHGLYEIPDQSGTNLSVQIIDLDKAPLSKAGLKPKRKKSVLPVLLVLDYAFGEQAYECMDELLKPYLSEGEPVNLNLQSISIMGKAGILEGKKGDIMLPTAHVFEGTADNYPLYNDLSAADFEKSGIPVYEGTMVTVLGTSLQNRDVLRHFLTSTWNAVGLEMEGAHFQKAIQSAARIRKSISPDVVVRYAYYASDNPLVSGSTLSSGSLGQEGVKPTYLITRSILEKILLV
ncbi:MAG: hypothetical protein U5L96_21615 [Owenweeksia sp.]|nr:hypothetical protein [Owenweeksia sp.]